MWYLCIYKVKYWLSFTESCWNFLFQQSLFREVAMTSVSCIVVLESALTWVLFKFIFFFIYFIYLFIFGCAGSSVHARAFSSCGKRGPLFIAVRGPLFIAVRGPFTIAAPPAAGHRLQTRRLSSCGSRAQLLRGMWDPPRPGLEPVSPALAGRLPTTAPPGKPNISTFIFCDILQGFLSSLYSHAKNIVFCFFFF